MLFVGFAVVFTVLIFFSFLIWFLKFLDEKLSKSTAEKPILKVQKEFFESKTEKELIAVITAAAVQTLGKKIKIHKIHFLQDVAKPSGWASSGRINVMSSHSINLKG